MTVDTELARPSLASDRATGGVGDRQGAKALAVVRVLLGGVFLWPFLDKTFGLGFATTPEKSWLSGGSPTAGFLGSVEGTFAGVFNSMAGHAWVDWSFMLGMLLVGLALITGGAMKLAAVGGVMLMVPLYLSSFPLGTHPFIDQHLIYAVLVVALAAARAGDTWGLGNVWSSIARKAGWNALA